MFADDLCVIEEKLSSIERLIAAGSKIKLSSSRKQTGISFYCSQNNFCLKLKEHGK